MLYKNLSTEPLTTIFKGEVFTEEWKPVVGFEAHYQISSFGRAKSNREGIIMRQWFVSGRGYLALSLQQNGIKTRVKMHRLVAKAFIDNPHNKPEVNHNDFNKANNFFMNLCWMTEKENTNHAQDGGRRPKAKPKPPKPDGKIIVKTMVINTETGFVYNSVDSLCEQIGMKTKELRRRLNGERKNDTPFKYVKGKYFKFRQSELDRDTKRFHELRMKLLGY